MILTWIFPDDIRALGSLTGGIVGIAVNLVVYLAAALFISNDEAEKARVDEMFETAKTKVRGVPGGADESLDDQLHDLAEGSKAEALDG
jgi:SSS family solute:Na+ symporter